jgi:phenylacetate-CoA ligase
MFRKVLFLSKIYRNPYASRRTIQATQKAGLESIVTHAFATVPYYQNLTRRIDGDIRDGNGDIDISKIPITRRADLIGLQETDLLSHGYVGKELNRCKTGGTTGEPLNIIWDQELDDLRAASLYRTCFHNGYRVTDVIAELMILPVPPNPLRKLGLLRRYAVPFDSPLEEQVSMLRSLRPTVLEGYPSRLLEIARELSATGCTEIRPRMVITNSEKLTPASRETIRDTFGVEPTDIYESWEFATMAWECRHHQGLHINEDLLKVEILNDGVEARPGEEGEVIVTDLHNKAMPFIRYAIGDMAVRSDGPCPCGMTFELLADISGRTAEKLHLADGTAITATVPLSGIVARHDGITEYQFIQNERGALEVLVVCNDLFTDTVDARLQKDLYDNFCLDKITVNRVQRIDKTGAGKMRPFVSNLDE